MPVRDPRFTDQVRREAVERVVRLMQDDGYSQRGACRAVGDDIGITGRTIGQWATGFGVSLLSTREDAKRTVVANLVVPEYNAERRRALGDLLFSRVEAIAEMSTDPGALKDLALTYGILIDKRRLEEGKATERHESIDLRTAIDRARQNLRHIEGGRTA
jgi:hypothetical protein